MDRRNGHLTDPGVRSRQRRCDDASHEVVVRIKQAEVKLALFASQILVAQRET
jgi:hypothetical protein